MSPRGAYRRRRSKVRAIRLLAVFFCALLLSNGCADPDEKPWESFEEDRTAVFGKPQTSPDEASPPAVRDVIRLQVTSIQLPLGASSEREDLWRQLAPGSASTDSRERLATNGVRLGVARREQWSQVADALTALGAQPLKTTVMVVIPGRPVVVPIGRSEQVQTLFTFRNDGTLEGTDLPPGDTALSLGIDLDAAGQRLRIASLPQIRALRDHARFVKDGEGYAFRQTPDVVNLYALAWEMTLSPQDFLVIGPGRDSHRTSSPGKHFLQHVYEDRLFETLLVLAPRLDKTRVGETSATDETGALQLRASSRGPEVP